MRRVPIAVVLLALAVTVSRAEQHALDLLRLVREADRIVVGRVAKIHVVDVSGKPRVAEVAVSRRLFGPDAGRIFVLASPTWTCDESHAVAGERAMFFLRNWSAEDVRFAMRSMAPWAKNPEFTRRLLDLCGKTPFQCIAWSGWGRMPIRVLAGEEVATTRLEPHGAPHSLPSIAWPCPGDDRVRSVPLEALLSHVESLVRIPPEGPLRDIVVGRPARCLKAVEAAGHMGGDTALAVAAVAQIDWTQREVHAAARNLQERIPDAAAGLLRLAHHDLPLVREAAARALAHNLDEYGESLVAALESRDVATRRLAVASVEWRATLDGECGLVFTARVLGDKDEVVRARAVRALAIAARDVIDESGRFERMLVEAAGDASPMVRRLALIGLACWVEMFPRGRTVLLKLLDDEDLRVRRAAVEGLLYRSLTVPEEVRRKRLLDPDPFIRGCLLAVRSHADMSKPLREALDDEDPWIRRCATLGLGRTHRSVSIAPLARALKDPDAEVRRIAVGCLRWIRVPASLAAIETVLDDEDAAVRLAAREAAREMRARMPSDK